MPLPGRIPYYMTGPAVKGLPDWVRRQNAIEAARGRLPGRTSKPKIKPKPKPKVVGTPNLGPYKPKPAPSPKTTVKNTAPLKAGGRGNAPAPGKPKGGTVVGGKNTGQGKGTNALGLPSGIGFNPQQMAATLAGLGYDAEISSIQAAIARNAELEKHALEQMQGWGAQVESQRARSAQEIGDIWEAAVRESGASGANIASLGGEVATGESGALGAAQSDLIAGLGASDQSFMELMGPILAAQSQDYNSRVSADFANQGRELGQQLTSTKKEKGQARQQALLDLMEMGWGRQMDLLQAQTAQEALRQSQAMFGTEQAQAEANVGLTQAQTEATKAQTAAERIAAKKSQVEINKLINNPSGFDLSDPNNLGQVGSASLSGSLGPRGAFIINPKVAWQNAMNSLAGLGISGDKRAVNAAWNAFLNSLNISHSKKMWGEYRVKNGKLIYNPAGKFKKGK